MDNIVPNLAGIVQEDLKQFDNKTNNKLRNSEKFLTKEERQLVLNVIARYDPRLFGYNAVRRELEKQDIKISIQAIRWYVHSKKWSRLIEKLREKMLNKHGDLMISKKAYRLLWLQKFVEDDDNKTGDRIKALCEARSEIEGEDRGRMAGDDWDKLPANVRDRFSDLFKRLIMAEKVIEAEVVRPVEALPEPTTKTLEEVLPPELADAGIEVSNDEDDIPGQLRFTELEKVMEDAKEIEVEVEEDEFESLDEGEEFQAETVKGRTA